MVKTTAEQKLRFRDKQVRILQLVNQANELLRQAAVGEQELRQLVSDLASECGTPLEDYNFNQETVDFQEKPKTNIAR